VAVDGRASAPFLKLSKKPRRKISTSFRLCWRYNYGHRDTFAKLQRRRHRRHHGHLQPLQHRALWMKTVNPNGRIWNGRSATGSISPGSPAITSSSRRPHPRQDGLGVQGCSPCAASARGRQSALILPTVTSTHHFSVVYDYQRLTRLFSIAASKRAPRAESSRFYGTKGTARSTAATAMRSKAKCLGWDGVKNNMYQTEHDEMFAAISQRRNITTASE